MAHGYDTMMNPSIEDLLEKTGSKFRLVSLSAMRSREITSYHGQLSQGVGATVPPQVTSTAAKPLSIAFEEISAEKITSIEIDPEAEAAAAAEEAHEEADRAAVHVAAAEATVAQRRAAGQPSSPYAGVSWAKKQRRWKAAFLHEGRKQHLGPFVDEDAAARAYDAAARRLRGNEAHGGGRASGRGKNIWRLNFPTEAEKQRNAE